MATRALQEWARRQAEGYPGVEVKNMSSSFRDGLAFCAIIHRHRPDLIEFDSLCKENVYENNRMAFEVAEQELGIPALLDAEDMVAMRVPDRLSILTYVSQLYNYFTNQNHAGVTPSMKRPAGLSPSEPSVKKVLTVNKQVLSPHSEFPVATEERSKRNTLSSTCAICSKHVHLVQRYLVDGKLYHRNCFRCKECSSTLLPGAYKAGAHSGTFVCTHHRGRVPGQPLRPLSVHSLKLYRGSLPAQPLPSASPRILHLAQVPTEASEGYNRGSLPATGLNAEESGEKSYSAGSNQPPSVPFKSYRFATDRVSELSNSIDIHEISKPEVEPPIQEETQRPTDHNVHDDQTENGLNKQLEPGSPSDQLTAQNEQQQQAVVMETDIVAPGPNTSESPATSSDQTPDTNQTAVNKEDLEEKLKTLPVPIPRKTSPMTTPRPVPRTRVVFGNGTNEASVPRSESSALANGGVTEQTTPVPKPRDRPQAPTERCTPESSRKGDAKPKDPPWLLLVNAEPKRRPAPPRPGRRPSPGDTQRETDESRSLNPFEVDDEETGDVSEKLTDTAPKPTHPWYSIQPASSPKIRKRPAPPAPNASPSAQRSVLSATPSPSLSMESIPGSSARSSPELRRRFEDSPGKSPEGEGPEVTSEDPEVTSESPAVASGSPELASTSPADKTPETSSETPTVAGEIPEAASEWPAVTGTSLEVARGSPGVASGSPATKESSTTSNEGPAPPVYHRPPPKPPASPRHPSPESNRLKAAYSDQPKSSCKENPFDRKSSPAGGPVPLRPRRGPKPARPPAPGHGFPLIKRKVHADQYIPEESIQGQLENLEQQLDELEFRGVALEEKLRNCENDDDEDDLLVDWFKLIHEKHLLVRRESELVYTFKQQNLEERQADVEYELRCLLNKPEKDWTDEDRGRDAELMQELITVIEQRNAIINSLDEDRQREEEEDKLLETMIKNKDFHKEPSSDVKKKAKFKPKKMLKFLSNKPEGKSKTGKEKNL
ncbi:MICAL-like protein 1 isoform X1 [Amblyraja radiata]|uniref:MICAL-like protein 1 isoform X1 n=1 Tax=Amblyraja radiata TaxID=386614 RepID=UPI0014030808|nr:MICAL-like protein 1 isoform X1 [Amblyraja radiata]